MSIAQKSAAILGVQPTGFRRLWRSAVLAYLLEIVGGIVSDHHFLVYRDYVGVNARVLCAYPVLEANGAGVALQIQHKTTPVHICAYAGPYLRRILADAAAEDH